MGPVNPYVNLQETFILVHNISIQNVRITNLLAVYRKLYMLNWYVPFCVYDGVINILGDIAAYKLSFVNNINCGILSLAIHSLTY